MMNKTEIHNILESNSTITENYVRKYLESKDMPELIREALSYSFFSNGKRIRPSLVMECGRMLEAPEESLLPFAAAVEMIHTYSLIHDDLPAMDNDEMRRGKPSNHTVYGQAQAILAGDALLNLSIEILLDRSDCTKAYTEAAAYLFHQCGVCGMIGGQSLDMSGSAGTCSFKDLKKMHSMKTGALINACCICPALLAGAPDDVLGTLGRYADDLGLLFQITDDILDFTGSTEHLGKTAGKDIGQSKSTYVTLYGYKKALEILNERHQSLIDGLDGLQVDASFLKGFAEFIKNRNH